MSKKTYLLLRDPIKCTDCGMCCSMLPAFLSERQGQVTIPETNYNTNSVIREAIAEAVAVCHEHALTLYKSVSL